MGQRESSPFAGVLDQLDRDNESGGEGGLSQLNLEGVRIDEATARVFADYMRRRDMSRLKHINLGGCGLTFAAFHHLVEAICSRTPGLIRLDMVRPVNCLESQLMTMCLQFFKYCFILHVCLLNDFSCRLVVMLFIIIPLLTPFRVQLLYLLKAILWALKVPTPLEWFVFVFKTCRFKFT